MNLQQKWIPNLYGEYNIYLFHSNVYSSQKHPVMVIILQDWHIFVLSQKCANLANFTEHCTIILLENVFLLIFSKYCTSKSAI